jgi:hypothetical protein
MELYVKEILVIKMYGAVCSATQQTMCPSGYELFVKPPAFSGKVSDQL